MMNDIIYQIFPDRFCNGNRLNDPQGIKKWGEAVDKNCFMGGDIEGIISKLDYIKGLGATAIYLNPIFESPSNHKYDTTDYYKIDPSFGTNSDFDRLIQESHNRNIKVIIDGVFNHTSTDFFAFKDILKNQQTSKYKSWYEIFKYPVAVTENPSYRACGGAYFLPKLNTQDKDVQDYIINVVKFWESKGIDGIRLDVPFEIHPSLLERIRQSTQLYLMGEIWGYGGEYVPKYFDGVTNYLLRELIKKAVVNQCITSKMFEEEWRTIESIYKDNIRNVVNLAGSHDTERIFTMCSGNVSKIKLFYALLFFLPGIPHIYYGDEIGLEGKNDPFCRGCMDWNEAAWNTEIQNYIKFLAGLRKNNDALVNGNVEFESINDRSMRIVRKSSTSIITALINFGFQPETINQTIINPMECKIF